MTWQISAHYTARSEAAAYRAGEYAKSTDERIERACGGIEQPAVVKCITEQVEASREDQRTEYDLEAQQDSADAAFWMAIVSTAALLATILALWYVKRTLDATWRVVEASGGATKAAEDAVTETRRIGETQSRAYLSVIRADLKIRDREDSPEFPAFELTLHLHNSGATPAVNVSYQCTAATSRWGDIRQLPTLEPIAFHEFLNNIPPSQTSKIPASCFGIAVHWREVVSLWKRFNENSKFGDIPILLICGVVYYEDVFGDTFRSQFNFWFEKRPLPDTHSVEKDDLPTIQARVPTFERISNREDYILKPPEKGSNHTPL